MTEQVRQHVDEAGRTFSYIHLDHGNDTLGMHFSAFYGGEGRFNPYRENFGGYFHRLKMLGSCEAHDWLFLCDEYGADRDGTYYTGERGDFFVERAVTAIIETVLASKPAYDVRRVVTLGSSMGATGALKFGLRFGVRGIVAIGPHVDLDLCVPLERERHIAAIVPSGPPDSPENWPYTRGVRAAFEAAAPGALPDLFVQSCEDDAGVYAEQAVPLVASWRDKGGNAWLDSRPHGGHTSDWATRALLLDVTDRLLSGREPDIDAYQNDPAYRGAPTRVRFERARRVARLVRRVLP